VLISGLPTHFFKILLALLLSAICITALYKAAAAVCAVGASAEGLDLPRTSSTVQNSPGAKRIRAFTEHV